MIHCLTKLQLRNLLLEFFFKLLFFSKNYRFAIWVMYHSEIESYCDHREYNILKSRDKKTLVNWKI